MSEREWQVLRDEASACTKCGLDASRTQVVFGVGRPDAKILFVGEAPGANEDLQGEPFVGQAGKLLDKHLTRVGLRREDVYIANILKCRPPDNRNPTAFEVECCSPFLRRQIALLRPEVVGALGTFAAQTLLATKVPIGKLRARPPEKRDGYWVLPMYHPAAALHNPRLLTEVEADFEKLRELLSRPPAAPAAPAEQMGLF